MLSIDYCSLVERSSYLTVFHRFAKGLDESIAKKSQAVDRRRLTHIWSTSARYQKLSTRRMTIAKQELRGASYEADDLETALVPAIAARSILKTIHMATQQHGSVGVTPSTGRVRVSASKATLNQLVMFVDDTIRGIESQVDSSFLNAFPEPVELSSLPKEIEPVGVLLDIGELLSLLDSNDGHSITASEGAPSSEVMLQKLSTVLLLNQSGDEWEAVGDGGEVLGRLRRRKHSYGVIFPMMNNYTIEDHNGMSEPLDRWLRHHAPFNVSFSSPEYFYASGKLFRRAGFAQEVGQVQGFLKICSQLDRVVSEKGGPYLPDAINFAGNSIFGVVETNLSVADRHVWCCDLGDEWADYIGVRESDVTFYHCKHGTPTTGASDFQIVVGQALKNLARIKFRREEMRAKVRHAQARRHWAGTHIPLLAKTNGGWSALENDLAAAIAGPNTTWRVALVVTALSLQDFVNAAKQTVPTPYFVQLVWLLSAFISACRERDAQPIIFCRT
jgi:hypothetical protein